MKLAQVAVTLIAVSVIGISAAVAAPVESIESGRAASLTKVEGFLSEKVVADHMVSLGLTSAQASARLALLSDAQLDQLAAHVDQIRAGGDIQSDTTRWGAWDSFWNSVETFFHNLFKLFFVWGNNSGDDLK